MSGWPGGDAGHRAPGGDRPSGNGASGPRLAAAAPDDGAPDRRLAAAVAADDGSAAARTEVLAALATARVFLALSAQAVGTEPSAVAGLRQESSAQMSLLSVVGSGGARALPAFLDGHQVQRWQEAARPVPVPGPLACRTVLDDGAEALLLDPLGARLALRGDLLTELAAGRVPVGGAALSARVAPATLSGEVEVDPGLLAALGRALAGEPVEAARVLAGPDGPVQGLVAPALAAAPDAAARLAALAGRLRAGLGADLPAAGLDLALVDADGPGQAVPVPRPARRGLGRLLGGRR